MFRSSGYVTDVRQVQGADGRTRNVGTGDYVERSLMLAHIRREDLQNQMAQAQAQLDQPSMQRALQWTMPGPRYFRPCCCWEMLI